MDDKLKAIIDKVVQLSVQTPEFATELRKRLQIMSSANASSDNEERIERIEKYLGLDFYVDTKSSNVDYSFVKLPDVRAQLISDNREMMRFRFGTRYHEIDFDEFCRYAHLQFEMLLNYFYDVKNNSDLCSIKNHIRQYNTKAEVDSANSLSAISFNSKLWAFDNEMHLAKRLKNKIENLRKVRNELSHRSTVRNEFDIDDYYNKLKSFNIPMKGKWINFEQLNLDVKKKGIFDSELEADYSNYTFMLWYLSKPFDDIVRNINDFAKVVSSQV